MLRFICQGNTITHAVQAQTSVKAPSPKCLTNLMLLLLTYMSMLHRAAVHHPWLDRDSNLLFRGSNLTGQQSA